MSRIRIDTVICAAGLAAVFLLSLALRAGLPWEHVFSGQWIKFTDNDAYFYMRLLDNFSRHFPLAGSFDPYWVYPDGSSLEGQRLFFVHLMSFFTRLGGGAVPSQQAVDLVGAWFPAVLGALMVFPAFFIGRAVFNKWAGLLSALFITFLPGEYLARTLLGNTDIHALEIFLSTTFMLFLTLTVVSLKGIALHPPSLPGLRRLASPLIYGAAAGLSLGIYLLSWQGALFFVFISFVWLVLQFIINHLRGVPSGLTGVAAACAYLVALLLSLAQPGSVMVWISLLAAIAAALALPAVSWFMTRKKINPALFPVAVLALAGAGILSLLIVSPQVLNTAFSLIAGFFTWNPASSIGESQPLLISQGSFTLALLWGNYTAGSVMALIGLGFLLYHVVKEGRPEMTLLAVWSILTLLAALALRRFAYYLAVDVALLSGYCGWLLLKIFGLKETAPSTDKKALPAESGKKRGAKSAAKKKARSTSASPAYAWLGAALVAALAVYPNTGPLPGGDRPFFDVATRALFTPSDAWYETLDWMRSNTPEPFGDGDYYYQLYEKPAASSAPARQAAGYSVLCWWDYGYWISRIAHRVPFSNPGTAQLGEQIFYTAQDEKEAGATAPADGMKYVVVNDYLVNWNSGFMALASDALQPMSKYCEVYYRQQDSSLSPVLMYYPEYYQTMAVRLYCFDGKEYTPGETAVISWENRTGSDGLPYREITALKLAGSYDEAASYVAAQTSGNWRIVGKDPNVSPVPLEALKDYRPAYSSSQKVKVGTAEVAEVKVFEYTGKS